MKQSRKDILVIGFALFSMFFGAGNLIFPPYLGLESGSAWVQGFVCYYIADVGLALAALFAILKSGDAVGVTGGLGRIPSALLMSVIILCIGPMVAIPRTAATTYEMSMVPLFPGVGPVWFSVGFFALILVLSLRQSAVVDIVGKILTPGLLLGLIILIVKGIVSPMGPVADHPLVEHVGAQGIGAGYQTMDVLAMMVFGVLILKTAEEKGYTERKAKTKVVAWAGLVAAGALLLTYLGLTYLGATSSMYYGVLINRSALVVGIVQRILGWPGVVIFAIIVALACVTTALALVSSSASYFADLCGGRVPYQVFVVLICVVSGVISNVGLDRIVAIAAPVLDIVYPPVLVLVVLAFVYKDKRPKAVLYSAAVGAMVTAACIAGAGDGAFGQALGRLPFAALGFGWILPALVCGLLGWGADRCRALAAARSSAQEE